jgi:hypothetical protein
MRSNPRWAPGAPVAGIALLGLLGVLGPLVAGCSAATPAAPEAALETAAPGQLMTAEPAGSAVPTNASPTEALVGTYVSGPIPAADGGNLIMTLTLSADGSAQVVNEYTAGASQPSVTMPASWQADGQQVTVTPSGAAPDGTQPLVFRVQGDDLVSDSMTVQGASPVVLERQSEGGNSASAGVSGTYVSQLSAENAGSRRLTLELMADGTARLETVMAGGSSDVEMSQPGRWMLNGADLHVALEASTGGEPKLPTGYSFELRGTDLVPTRWDEAVFGETGPGTLVRQAE